MPPKTPDYDTKSTLQATADKLREVLDGFELHGDGEHPAVISDLARIATALTTTCAEIRQAQKAKLREVAQIPHEQLVAHLLSLPMPVRLEVAAKLTNSDAEESLL